MNQLLTEPTLSYYEFIQDTLDCLSQANVESLIGLNINVPALWEETWRMFRLCTTYIIYLSYPEQQSWYVFTLNVSNTEISRSSRRGCKMEPGLRALPYFAPGRATAPVFRNTPGRKRIKRVLEATSLNKTSENDSEHSCYTCPRSPVL